MDPRREQLLQRTRRYFLGGCGLGLGAAALAGLLDEPPAAAAPAAEDPLSPKPPHHRPRARSVIYLHMAGGPSTLDLLDHKPKLSEMHGKSCPESLIAGQQFAFIRGTPKMLGTPFKFARHGRCGAEVSELLPHLAGVVDDLLFVRGMHTDQFNHAPAQLLIHTGSPRMGRPSMGSWVSYGLGSANRDLPAFVALLSGAANPDAGSALWNSAFLPTIHQGVPLRSEGDPVLFLSNPAGIDDAARRRSLQTITALNRVRHRDVGDPEIETRTGQFELAYRMQTSVPELMDVSREPREVHELYGTEPGKKSFANNCLLARRLVEKGVRFVHLFHWGWDSHGDSRDRDLRQGMPERCKETDRAAAALVTDLKRRGLLDSTLVVWGGEFGRTPMSETKDDAKFLGRDHHQRSFTIWMAGGGVKAGVSYGATDELGYNVVEKPVHVHDLQATILHLLGLAHERLTFRFQGRDYRLTDVHGNVVTDLLA